MKTRVLNLGKLSLPLIFCLFLTSCNQDDYYQKEFLDNPYQKSPTNGSVEDGDQDESSADSGGGAQGGADQGGVNGGTNGGATTGSSSGGANGGGAVACGSNNSDPNASTPCLMTENFRQSAEETKKIDILWVIDNSGSMRDEQASLGQNFSSFIQDFITKNVDFKMAITTTDTTPNQRGLMVNGSAEKLNSVAAAQNPVQFLSDFNTLVNVGISGSGNEKGLEATEGFMERYASTFLRSDAYLAVVIVSDEEDQSPQTPSYYADLLKSFKDEAGLVKLYSIVDTGLTNVGSNGITTGYQRYAEASSLTAGVVSNIRDDFNSVLSEMGDSIINLLDSFALAHDPVVGTLAVYVNDILDTNYTFDANSRSIKFNPNAVPPVGSEIRVTYEK